jgi:hypothetical protein
MIRFQIDLLMTIDVTALLSLLFFRKICNYTRLMTVILLTPRVSGFN